MNRYPLDKARLDPHGTETPKTRLLSHPVRDGAIQYHGTLINGEYEDEHGNRIALSTKPIRIPIISLTVDYKDGTANHMGAPASDEGRVILSHKMRQIISRGTARQILWKEEV